MRTFRRDGVLFRFPEGWIVESDDDGDGWAVTVSSPETAFFLVSLRPEAANPAQVAGEALAAVRAEYKDVDAAEAVDTLAGVPAVGHDFDFLSVDTAVIGWTRAIDTTAGPLLLLCQVADYDRDANEPVLRAMAASLVIEDVAAAGE